MPVLVPPSGNKYDASQPSSVDDPQLFYTRRLEVIRAKIQHLESRLRPGGVRFNPYLFDIWQSELAYWTQQEKDVTARLRQLGVRLKDTGLGHTG